MNIPPAPTDLDVLLDRALATGGETTGFDFKEVLDFRKNGEHKIKLLRAVGAFANTDKGGHIIIGVTNDRRVVGITPELAATYDQTPIQKMAGEYFAPPPALQVRHHEREGKRLVFVEVAGFREVPSIVKKYEIQGKEKLQDGTFLVRNGAAESALLTSEAELRILCDAIAARRADAILRLLPTAAPTTPSPSPLNVREAAQVALRNGLALIRVEANRMADHAEQLNIGLFHNWHNLDEYLSVLFRPALMETALIHVSAAIANQPAFLRDLTSLRSAATSADEETQRVLSGVGDVRRLEKLVRDVINSGRGVTAWVDRLLPSVTP